MKVNTAQSEIPDLCGDLIPRCYRKNGKDGRVTVKRRENKMVNGEKRMSRMECLLEMSIRSTSPACLLLR